MLSQVFPSLRMPSMQWLLLPDDPSPDGSIPLSFCQSHRTHSVQGWLAENSVMKQQFYIIHSTPMPPANCTLMCMSTFVSVINAQAKIDFPVLLPMCKVQANKSLVLLRKYDVMRLLPCT